MNNSNHSPSKSAANTPAQQSGERAVPTYSEQSIDTINQIFALFSINYHNQYHAAYGNRENENTAKKLWLNSLHSFESKTLLQAAQRIVEQSEYLPALSVFIDACDELEHALPDVRAAYLEACRASSNLTGHRWSHAIVHQCGKNCGWSTLRSEPEARSWPLFKSHYLALKERARDGQQFALPAPEKARAEDENALSLEERKQKLAELKASL